MKLSIKHAAAFVSIAALGLAACGDDDSGSDDTSAPSESMAEDTSATSETMADGTSATTEAMADGTSATTEAMADGTSATTEAMADGGGAEGETLTVGVKYDQPLFGVNTPDGVVGFDADIARHIGEELGRPVEFTEAVSANRETFIQNGTVDMVVATYTWNDERDEVIDFAGPYYIAGQDIMVEAGNPKGITGIDSVTADTKICSVEGSTSLANLQEMAPDAQISTFDTYSKCADALGQGRVDAVTTDNVILLGLIAESDGAYELVGKPFTEEPYGIGVPTDSPLRCEINTILQAAYDDGTWASIYESTIGTVDPKTPEPPTLDTEGC